MKIVFNNVFFRCRNRLRRKGFEHFVWRAASKVRSGNAGEVYFFCVQTHTTNTSCRFPLLLEGRAGGNCLDIQLAQLPSGSGCLNQLSLGSGAAKFITTLLPEQVRQVCRMQYFPSRLLSI